MPPKFSRELTQPTVVGNLISRQPRTSPCEAYCPAGNPIQKVNTLAKEGKFEEALEYLMARNPLPGICGRVCPHPCERECNRNNYDQPLAIRALERAASDLADATRTKRPMKKAATGKRVAVVGSGPAGLTAAYFLALLGHDVTMFEAAPVLGGVPRISIPDYRLPTDVVDRAVGNILGLGVQARTNSALGRDISAKTLRNEFDACVIATGAWRERSLGIPGADHALRGLSFLRDVNLGQIREVGARVAVIGGGGVAFDCAFTAKRLGAKEVHVICLEDKDNMVAHPDDICQGQEEGIKVHNSGQVSRIAVEDGQVKGLEYCEVTSFEFDETGALCVTTAEDKQLLAVDTVILAVGQKPELAEVDALELNVTKKGTLEADPQTMATSVEGIFAAGDVVLGASTVAASIGSGRLAAIGVEQYLNPAFDASKESLVFDSGTIAVLAEPNGRRQQLEQHVVKFEELMHVDYYESKPRVEMKRIALSPEVRGFEEVNKGYGREEAAQEAERCFHCGQCASCGSCVEDCPGYVLTMGENGPEVAYPDECWHCGNCRISCPCGAVYYEFPLYTMV
jgi:formate dehydrogenase beta subunit